MIANDFNTIEATLRAYPQAYFQILNDDGDSLRVEANGDVIRFGSREEHACSRYVAIRGEDGLLRLDSFDMDRNPRLALNQARIEMILNSPPTVSGVGAHRYGIEYYEGTSSQYTNAVYVWFVDYVTDSESALGEFRPGATALIKALASFRIEAVRRAEPWRLRPSRPVGPQQEDR